MCFEVGEWIVSEALRVGFELEFRDGLAVRGSAARLCLGRTRHDAVVPLVRFDYGD